MPNRLGFKPSTCEYRIMRGELGGSGVSKSVVPHKFNLDRRVERIDGVLSTIAKVKQCAIAGTYVIGFSQNDLAQKLGITRGKLRRTLEKAYADVYMAIDV